jgi:hypothetical protein
LYLPLNQKRLKRVAKKFEGPFKYKGQFEQLLNSPVLYIPTEAFSTIPLLGESNLMTPSLEQWQLRSKALSLAVFDIGSPDEIFCT